MLQGIGLENSSLLAKTQFLHNILIYHCPLLQIDELAGRPIDLVEFSPDYPTTLLVVHGARDTSDIRTFITIWNISQPSQPLFLLSSTSLVTSACFQFDKSSFIFGGCEDGQVLLWDLRYRLLCVFGFKGTVSVI